jgi:hypothetical protein
VGLCVFGLRKTEKASYGWNIGLRCDGLYTIFGQFGLLVQPDPVTEVTEAISVFDFCQPNKQQ